MIYYCIFETKYGACALGCTPQGVVFATSPRKFGSELDQELGEMLSKLGANNTNEDGAGYSCEVEADAPEVSEAVHLLSDFYAGKADPKLMTFPLDYKIIRPTAFQKQVWDITRKTLAWSAIASYQDVAAMLGKPGAARAVGNAMSTCPAPGFIPCQRVVGSSGNHYVLGGYGSALEFKRILLKAEGIEL